jgi:hypothetical protein
LATIVSTTDMLHLESKKGNIYGIGKSWRQGDVWR